MARQTLFNGDRFILDISGDAGATLLLATGPLRFLEVRESLTTSASASNTLQGFQYQLPTAPPLPGQSVPESWGPWITIPPPATVDGDTGYTTMEVGDPRAVHGPLGILLGNGPDTPGAGQDPIPATALANLRSLTGTATSVVVTQYF